jgi:hypothetical protein
MKINKEIKLMKDYPAEIIEFVKKRSKVYNEEYSLEGQFIFHIQPEGAKFWEKISDGDYDVFYDMYCKAENEKVLKKVKEYNTDCNWSSGNFIDEFLKFDGLEDIEVNEPEIVSDSIVEKVIDSFKERSNVGIKKYGVTLDRDDLSFLEWINHLQMELQDAILYAEKIKSAKSMYYSFDLANIKSVEMKDGQLTITTKD